MIIEGRFQNTPFVLDECSRLRHILANLHICKHITRTTTLYDELQTAHKKMMEIMIDDIRPFFNRDS